MRISNRIIPPSESGEVGHATFDATTTTTNNNNNKYYHYYYYGAKLAGGLPHLHFQSRDLGAGGVLGERTEMICLCVYIYIYIYIYTYTYTYI